MNQHLPRVAAVVVAHNRRDLLVEVLDALAAQTASPIATVVVDNASDDGSGEVARDHRIGADVLTMERNTGGAGGFTAGVARALTAHDPDWVWLMDDDTIPEPDALAALLDAVADRDDVTVAGSRVLWTDGRDHPMNTPRSKPLASRREQRRASRASLMPIRSSSFVSLLARADTVWRRGLPVADFFLWNDDFEYSTRLLRGSRGVFVPHSRVVHKTRVLGSTDADPGERFYFEVRNKIWMWRFSHGLAPLEKLLYGASSLRRWGRTLRRSTSRGVLVSCLRRGWRDGWRTRPRGLAEVYEGMPAALAAVGAYASRRPSRRGR